MGIGTGTAIGLRDLIGWRIYLGISLIIIGIYGFESLKMLKQDKTISFLRIELVRGIAITFIVIGALMIITKFF